MISYTSQGCRGKRAPQYFNGNSATGVHSVDPFALWGVLWGSLTALRVWLFGKCGGCCHRHPTAGATLGSTWGPQHTQKPWFWGPAVVQIWGGVQKGRCQDVRGCSAAGWLGGRGGVWAGRGSEGSSDGKGLAFAWRRSKSRRSSCGWHALCLLHIPAWTPTSS